MGKAPYQELLDKKEFIPEELLAYLMSVAFNDLPNSDISMFYDFNHTLSQTAEDFPNKSLSIKGKEQFYQKYKNSLFPVDSERLLNGLETIFILKKFFGANIDLYFRQNTMFYYVFDKAHSLKDIKTPCPSIQDKKALDCIIPELKELLIKNGLMMKVFYKTSVQDKRAIQFGMKARVTNIKKIRKTIERFLVHYSSLYKSNQLNSNDVSFSYKVALSTLLPFIQYQMQLNEQIQLRLNKNIDGLVDRLLDYLESINPNLPNQKEKLGPKSPKTLCNQIHGLLSKAHFLEVLLALSLEKKIQIKKIHLLPVSFWNGMILIDNQQMLFPWSMVVKIKYTQQTLILDERDNSAIFRHGLIENVVEFSYVEFFVIQSLYKSTEHMMLISKVDDLCSATKTVQSIRDKLEMYIDKPKEWLVTIKMPGTNRSKNCYQINLKYMDIHLIQATK